MRDNALFGDETMIEYVNEANLNEFETYLQSRGGSYLQSSKWAKLNPNWHWRAFLRRDENKHVTGAASVLIREIPLLPYQMMYCCRGPVFDDEESLRDLLDEIAETARSEGVCLVRLDPPIEEHDIAYMTVLEEYRYRTLKHKRSRPAQPRRNWVVPLQGSWEQVQQGFSQTHIQSIRMALRSGVEIRGGGRAMAAAYAELQAQQAFRDGKIANSEVYYSGLADGMGAHTYMAYLDSRPVAGAVVVGYGRRLTAISMANISEPGTRAMHLLMAAILQSAAEAGYDSVEFPGVPADPASEIYELDAGFGGGPVATFGEMDWLRRGLGGRVFRSIERIQNRINLQRNFIETR